MEERMYVIKDHVGNYYKKDDMNQLVVAKEKDEVTLYTYAQANNKLDTAVKKKFYVIEKVNWEEDNECVEKENEQVQEALLENTSVESEEKKEERTIIEPSYEYDLSKIDWKEYILQLSYVVSGLDSYKSELEKAQAKEELKMCDLVHFAEFNEVDEIDAEAFLRRIKDDRANRRKIKDELAMIDIFKKNIGINAMVTNIEKAKKEINKFEHRKYKPRFYDELFTDDNSLMASKKAIKNSYVEQNEDSEEYMEEVTMEYRRVETPYDNRSNNWAEFVKGQMEFYKNAKQYMINLQLDLDYVDEQIEILMKTIDDTNCSAVQGYKFLMELKNLRKISAEIENELEAIRFITKDFDIDSMAYEYESQYEVLKTEFYDDEDSQISEPEEETVLSSSDVNTSSIAV